MRADRAVELTKSENITVTWRRSARSSGGAFGVLDVGRCVNRWRLAARVVAQSSESVEQLEPVTDCCDAKLLQGLVRQARKNRLVYLFAGRLIPELARACQ
jgi:hypothetical protein